MNGINYFSPKSRYQDTLDALIAERDRIGKKIALISNLRLVAVVAGIAAAIVTFRSGMYGAAIGTAAGGILLFVALALRHNTLFDKSAELKALIEINRMGVERWRDGWRNFSESGVGFVDNDHPYSSDLDVFGKGSLFQFCCCARTFYGKLRLAELLKFKDGDNEAIIARQRAVENLAEHFSWRQRFESAGFENGVAGDPHTLISWAESGSTLPGRINGWRLALLLPVVTVIVALSGYLIAGTVVPAVFLIGLQVVIVALTTRHHFRLFGLFETLNNALKPFGRYIRRIEEQPFVSSYLQELRSDVIDGTSGPNASAAMRQLADIIDASEVRRSPLPWFLANAALLWDVRCRVKLDQWKRRHGRRVRTWLGCIGEFEALSSLALLRFDHPEWVFPVLSENGGMSVQAEGLGHPLLPHEQRVVNTFSLGPPGGSIAVITGSNMSGKSTFLRTVGCNLVLAYAGGPVCAVSFSAPLLALYTSMRSGDDLLSNTSTFYAELLRIRKIVDAAKRGQPLLFLIDELFSGTNSADRHDGAVALLRELSRTHTLGLISTHDLALCSLAGTKGPYTNYHFREQYDGNDLEFDYLLREGPSTTRNALFLMKKAGIDVAIKKEK